MKNLIKIILFLIPIYGYSQDIEKISDNEIRIVKQVETVYTKEYIDQRCEDYRIAIENLNNEAAAWFSLQQASEDLKLKTQDEIKEAEKSEPQFIEAQTLFSTPKVKAKSKRRVRK